MNQSVFEEIRNIMVEESGMDADKITPDAAFSADLDLNSLEMMNIVMAIEEQMDISLDEHRLGQIKTVSSLVDYIAEIKG